tara:strand:+ start:203 stop:1006 length:804 start_codon:yes stop_codon:yes gene_type:complete
MSSKIKVDTIENVAGSGNVSLGSGHNLVVPGNLNVDTNLLDVDASNDTVGIGTTVNTRKLNINAGSFGHMLLDTADASHGVQILGQTNATANSGFDIQYSSAGGLKMRTLAVKGISFQTSASAGSPVEHLAIDTSGRVTTPNQPSFSMSASPSNTGGRLHSFGTTQHNTGSHYNNSTGKFTAPVAGKYFFSATIWPSGTMDNAATYLVFFKNSTEQTGAHGITNHQALTITAVYHLAANDTVHVQIQGGWSVQGSSPRNNFHGYMLG